MVDLKIFFENPPPPHRENLRSAPAAGRVFYIKLYRFYSIKSKKMNLTWLSNCTGIGDFCKSGLLFFTDEKTVTWFQKYHLLVGKAKKEGNSSLSNKNAVDIF